MMCTSHTRARIVRVVECDECARFPVRSGVERLAGLRLGHDTGRCLGATVLRGRGAGGCGVARGLLVSSGERTAAQPRQRIRAKHVVLAVAAGAVAAGDAGLGKFRGESGIAGPAGAEPATARDRLDVRRVQPGHDPGANLRARTADRSASGAACWRRPSSRWPLALRCCRTPRVIPSCCSAWRWSPRPPAC